MFPFTQSHSQGARRQPRAGRDHGAGGDGRRHGGRLAVRQEVHHVGALPRRRPGRALQGPSDLMENCSNDFQSNLFFNLGPFGQGEGRGAGAPRPRPRRRRPHGEDAGALPPGEDHRRAGAQSQVNPHLNLTSSLSQLSIQRTGSFIEILLNSERFNLRHHRGPG